jgi:hypothetical protein
MSLDAIRGASAIAYATVSAYLSKVLPAWRTAFPTVLSTRQRSRFGRASRIASGQPTCFKALSRLSSSTFIPQSLAPTR